MKYIMCAKTFPAYHPRAGQPTGFRESILAGTKLHTLRYTAANRKTGDTVSLREWAAKPYRSKQVEFAQCEIEIRPGVIENCDIRGNNIESIIVQGIAEEDGFDNPVDFQHWFTSGKDEPINFDGVCIWFRNVRAIGVSA